jgi:hypothetical protein
MNNLERAALLRNKEQAERLSKSHRPSGGELTNADIERASEILYDKQAADPGNRLDDYFRNTSLLTGAEPALEKERRKLEAAASRFRTNEEYELLLKWEKAGDPRIEKLDPTTRMSLGFYRRDKDAHRDVERD